MDIRSDRQKGLSYVELGRKYHMDPRTAKRYAESPQKPEYTLSEPKPTKMDPYNPLLPRATPHKDNNKTTVQSRTNGQQS